MAGAVSNILLGIIFRHSAERWIIGNLFILIEFLLVYSYYRPYLKRGYNKVLIGSMVVFAFSVAGMFYTVGEDVALSRPLTMFNWAGATLLCIPYIIFAFCGFLQIVREQKIIHLERSSYFIVNSTFLIYYATVFIVFLSSQYLVDRAQIEIFWHFFEGMNIMKYILLTFVFILKDR
jgi:hypothetical protein